MRHAISLQYLKDGDELPRAGYEFTDGDIELPEGATVPRVGEFIQLVTNESAKSYVVLAVHTRIMMVGSTAQPNWHTFVTVGPDAGVKDQRLLAIRE